MGQSEIGVLLHHHGVSNFLNNYVEASDIVVKASTINSCCLNRGVISLGLFFAEPGVGIDGHFQLVVFYDL